MKTTILFSYLFLCIVILFITSCQSGNSKNAPTDSTSTGAKKKRDRGTPCKKIKELNARFEQEDSSVLSEKIIKKSRISIDSLIYPDTTGFIYAIITIKNQKKGKIQKLDVHLDTVFNGKPDSVAFAGKSFPFKLHDFPLAIKMEKTAFLQLQRDTDCKFFLFLPGIDTAWHDEAQDCNSRHFTLGILGSAKGDSTIHRRHCGPNVMEAAAVPGKETWPKGNFIWTSGKVLCD